MLSKVNELDGSQHEETNSKNRTSRVSKYILYLLIMFILCMYNSDGRLEIFWVTQAIKINVVFEGSRNYYTEEIWKINLYYNIIYKCISICISKKAWKKMEFVLLCAWSDSMMQMLIHLKWFNCISPFFLACI